MDGGDFFGFCLLGGVILVFFGCLCSFFLDGENCFCCFCLLGGCFFFFFLGGGRIYVFFGFCILGGGFGVFWRLFFFLGGRGDFVGLMGFSF